MSLPTTQNILKLYPADLYVETGIWRGDGIQQAIEAGFEHVIGIDNDPACVEFCLQRFNAVYEKQPWLSVVFGDSADCLFLAMITVPFNTRCTFFLDAHWQFLEGTEPGKNPFPLLDELGQISKLSRNDHTIIIDDWHIFYPDRVGYSKKDILFALKEINPNYKFTYHANPVIDGILVSHV